MAQIPEHLREEVEKWRNYPRVRPEQIETPGSGQESVWDYPRPPRTDLVSLPIRVEFAETLIAKTKRAVRVLETAGPPVYYIPRDDIHMEFLEPVEKEALCEWKGISSYWTVRVGDLLAKNAAWSYAEPWPGYEAIADYIAFNASKMSGCFVDRRRVTPQPGHYYGGWITPEVVGPFKGEPGTENW
jgi:uncharacterized protein (DUF427 family)